MEPKDWKITNIKSVDDSAYGKKVKFSLEGYANEVSCFTKFPDKMTVGSVVYGHIEVKDGKWHNFKFDKKTATGTPGGDARVVTLLESKVIPMLQNIHERLLKLEGKDVHPIDDTGYPQMNETNDSHGISQDDQPF